MVRHPWSISTQAQLLPSTSSAALSTSSESHPPIPLLTTVPSTSNSLNSVALSSFNQTLSPSNAPSFHPCQL
ncbi:hypothetical protein TNCV_1224971 [Trichonephila clavipes]|nr:hypothetical protein TNCV_1224971 [Trichonephila clavipes]